MTTAGPVPAGSATPAPAATLLEVPETVRSGLLQAGPLALAGLLANGAGAVITILLARLLPTRGYGSLAQLNGLFLVVSLPGSAVTVGVVRRVAAWQAAGAAAGRVQGWARRVYARGAVVASGFALAVLLARNWIDDRLSSPGAAAVVAMLVAATLWVLLSFDRGLLQARRRYRTLATNLVVEGGMRVVAMLCLVGAGLGVAGAAGGVLLAEALTAVHARVAANRAWARPGAVRGVGDTDVADGSPRGGAAVVGERRAAALDLVTALVAMALLAFLQNVDVIVLARDAPHRSGSYAAISVASKAMVFGALALGGYLLPEAAIRWHQGGHAIRQLAVTLLLLAVPAGLLLAAAVSAPGRVLSIVFSARYAGASEAFAPLVLAMICLSVTVTFTMYLLAIGRRWVAGVLLAGSGAGLAATAAAHGAPLATAHADLLVQGVLATAMAVGFALAHRARLAGR
ncbi:MAG TPA: hypothetical protein VKV36_03875 [Acidimicrobiales bacterium]|nr:hypothetical protein [Acidimicrobiales bacterium]